MRRKTHRIARLAWAFSLATGLASAAEVPVPPPSPEGAAFFEAKVRPVLAEHCVGCHGPKKQSAGLRLDLRGPALAGGDGGPVVVPGKVEESPLIEAIGHAAEPKMPPDAKLPAPAIEALTTWVAMGAPWPEGDPTPADAKANARESHWSFRPVQPAQPPALKTPDPDAGPIDAFLRAALDAKGMAPSPRADRRTLIRRATFDLTGLPATPEEVDAFLADPAPTGAAFAKVVDRLLASPHYGERWARHWLDVARYADTKGYVFTEERRYPYSYTFRDYVINAFNDDLPYDQFIVEQIAADHLGPQARPGAVAGMGFLTVGRRFLNDQQEIIDDRIDVTTRGFLGLTVACARCHDHKFDPIPTDDYYSLHGVFASSTEPSELPELPSPVPPRGPRRLRRPPGRGPEAGRRQARRVPRGLPGRFTGQAARIPGRIRRARHRAPEPPGRRDRPGRRPPAADAPRVRPPLAGAPQ